MTRDAEQLILEEMVKDEEESLKDPEFIDEAQDHMMGFDEDTGELDQDAGMLFPQPITNFD